jgi:uncharacterized membrane protein YccC
MPVEGEEHLQDLIWTAEKRHAELAREALFLPRVEAAIERLKWLREEMATNLANVLLPEPQAVQPPPLPDWAGERVQHHAPRSPEEIAARLTSEVFDELDRYNARAN